MQGDVLAVQVVLTLLHCSAVTTGIFRLYRRHQTGQIDYDDYVAAFALVLNILFFPTLWFPKEEFTADLPPSHERIMFSIVSSWFVHTVWTVLLWATRISLGLSITRVLPKKTRFYYATWILIYVILAGGIAVEAVSIAECAISYRVWSKTAPYQCNAGVVVYSVFTGVDVTSDLLLVGVPLWALWRLPKLDRKSQIAIKIGFAANGLTAAASLVVGIVNVAVYLPDPCFVLRVATHALSITSIMACNSLVIVTSLYRHFRTKAPILPQRHVVATPPRPVEPPPPCATENYLSTKHGSPDITDYTDETSTSARPSGFSSDLSGPSSSGQPSGTRLTLTVVHTDPSFFSASDLSMHTIHSQSFPDKPISVDSQ
ncbi:hypothetical protein CPC08DRAFT_819726 [Agrocybe pediades]|nr:hypothetical protein CPC08DRAFT_819726 [Agrocybe pediades]